MNPRQPASGRNGERRYPVGVEILYSTDAPPRTHARVWAPDHRVLEFVTDPEGRATRLHPEGNGYFSGDVADAPAGTRYRFRLDGGESFPDPVSRFQPEGPHGPSMVVDSLTFEWSDRGWHGPRIDGPVIYELHIGTFTRAGTFRGAAERLPELVDLGVSLIEVMPLADFPGQFGWGYDGVNLFAPSRLYGTPDDLRAFVDAAHRLEIGVMLDVVYNHFGPEGNYLPTFARDYLSARRTEWGDALNFDGPGGAPVREYIVTNARYWIEEFHIDGLRLDATQQIFDDSKRHILEDIRDAVREAAAAAGRTVLLVAENEPQDSRLVRPREQGGCGLDALWSDDFHHAARVAATGRSEAYLSGYRGVAQEFVSAAKYGFLYQGQWLRWQKRRRGLPGLDLEPGRFVTFIQNHDQVANTPGGRRLHMETSPGRYRALTALLLLLPQTPMLFQGQEFCASAPFLYFADLPGQLGRLVHQGRTTFVSQFVSIRAQPWDRRVEDPGDPSTFVRCKLEWSERAANAPCVALHRDLIRIRHEDPVIAAARAPSRSRALDGAVLAERAFVLRFFGGSLGERLLIVNLGERLHGDPAAEPLLAPPAPRLPPRELAHAPLGRLRPPPAGAWRIQLSTDAPEYGGWGAPPLETPDDGWWIPSETAVLLRPTDDSPSSR